jgi:hypothetical protein
MAGPTSIRLPDTLNAALDAYAHAHNLSRSAAILRLLSDALGCSQVSTTDVTTERIESLEARIEALERRSEDVVMADYNPGLSPNQVLGELCHQQHEWQGTGKSRRYRNNGRCVDCANSAKREKRRAANKATR